MTQKFAVSPICFGRRLRFLKELVDGFMVQRTTSLAASLLSLSASPAKKCASRDRVEINAERIGDPRLATAQAVDVVVAIAMVEHAKRASLDVRRSARPQTSRGLPSRCSRSPRTVAARSGRAAPAALPIGAGRQAVVRRHEKMIGANLPAVFDIGVPRRIVRRLVPADFASSAATQPRFAIPILPASRIFTPYGVSHWPSRCS